MVSISAKKIKLSKIVPNPDNPRTITTKNVNLLVKSITEFPEMMNLREIVVDENMVVLGGNMRLLALRKIGTLEVNAKIVSGLTDKQKREFIIKDNASFGVWDMDALASSWGNLPLVDWGVDLPKGWDDDKEKQAEEDLLSSKDQNLDGLGSVYDLKSDIRFDGVGFFDFPEIKKEMVLSVDNLSTWAGPNATRTEPPYVYNYATDSTINLPWDKTVVSFYTEDARFERLWENTAEVVKRMLNKKIVGCFTPNFSTYFSYPKALRVYNIFRSRWVGRYMQEAGIKVVPDITCGHGDIDCVCDGIPRKSPVAIQAHRKYNKDELVEKDKILNHVVKTLDPSVMWVYATEDRLDMFPILRSQNVRLLVPRTVVHLKEKIRRKEMEQHG